MNIYHKLLFEYEEKTEIALLTVTAVTGSNPAQVGKMMIIDKEGKVLEGTIAGGSIEEQAKKEAVALMEMGESKTIRIDIQDEFGNECIGTVDIFVQVFVQKDEIIIIGAGNVGHSVYRIAEMLDYDIIIVDDRPDYATKERFPKAKSMIIGEFEVILKDLKIHENSNIVISTHAHEYDELALLSVVNSNAKYIGMLSNRRKAKLILENLEKKGISNEKIEKVYAPIGLSIGGTKPEEIGVSIMAEVLAVKHDKMFNFKNEKRNL